MKKTVSFFSAFALFVVFSFFSGCATIKIEAPKGQKVIMQPSVESQPKVTKKKVWYVLWGLVPVTDNSTATVIKNENLSETSVKGYYGFDDVLVSLVLGGMLTVNSYTMEVHGK